MIIQHNMMAANNNRTLGINANAKAVSSEKLSTGYRVNRAADDASGLAISEKMRAQIRGLDQGSINSSDGISLLQVADGALSDVHSMLDRLKELSVQSANDTNTPEDRQMIQMEVEALLDEIDRIADDTEFNTRKIFKGTELPITDKDGNAVKLKDIPFSDFGLGNGMGLRELPFSSATDYSSMRFSVGLGDKYNLDVMWNLVFGGGGTSHPSMRVNYTDDTGSDKELICNLYGGSGGTRALGSDVEEREAEASEGSSTETEETGNVLLPSGSNYIYDESTRTVSRVLTFTSESYPDVNFEITQKIRIVDEEGADYKYYDISYEVENKGTKNAQVDFMYHVDTAYNNNDHVEEYCVAGTIIPDTRMYTSNSEYSGSNVHALSEIDSSTGLTITNLDAALPFSERIQWNGSNEPDTVTFGPWPSTREWSSYNNLNSILGRQTHSSKDSSIDMDISLIWSNRDLNPSDHATFHLQYGIVETKKDSNIPQDQVKMIESDTIHASTQKLWIQSGANSFAGINIEIGEMSTTILGINSIDLSTQKGATSANAKVERAILQLGRQRSVIGAQHNRLEYAKDEDDVTSENLQAAESKIRDLNMADEMVKYAKNNILVEAGQALLAQSNQAIQGVLQLLG